MHRLLSLLPLALLLVGCRSSGPTVNPFMGSTTVPAQPTGAIGPGANNAPYYPPNIVPGQPSTVPPAGPYGVPVNNGQQWMPQGAGAAVSAPMNNQYAATNAAVMYDPQVQPASATTPVSGVNSLAVSSPVSYAGYQESAVRVPTDSSPLVTQRQQLPPVVQFAPVTASQPQQQLPAGNTPTVYNTQQGYTQTIVPAQPSSVPLTAMNTTVGQPMMVAPQSMPAAQVYGSSQPLAMTVSPQQMQPQYSNNVQLQPIPQYQSTAVATRTSGPSLAYGPTLAATSTPVIRQMPAVEITDLPPARGALH